MFKTKISVLFLTLVALLILPSPVTTSGDEDGCSCFSQVSLTILDDNCKTFCKEYLGMGTCVGWDQLDTHCVSGSFCIMKWQVFCANGDTKQYSTWDYCQACPLYNPPNSEGESDNYKKPDTTRRVKNSAAVLPASPPAPEPVED
jgi:hypothetical protein